MTPAQKKPTAHERLRVRIEKSIQDRFMRAQEAQDKQAEAEAMRLYLLYQEKVRERLAREGVR